MECEAYRQYQLESQNWLKSGRRDLLTRMLASASRGRSGLEILEIGAGVGQNIAALTAFGSVDVVEINEVGLRALRTMTGIRSITDQPIPFACDATYDAVVAMDVLEHIDNDRYASQWIGERLRPGGVLFATVPAYQWLYSEHDVALHHFRRYTMTQFRGILPPSLKILRCGYFNTVLFPLGATMRVASIFRTRHSNRQPRKHSSLVPRFVDSIFKLVLRAEVGLIDKGIDFPFGLSIYCLAQR